MKKKRISALALALLLLVSLLTACGKEEEEAASVEVDAALVGEFATLDPAYCTTAAEKSVILHLYENLMTVTVDRTGAEAVLPGVAESYTETVNYDGTVTYLFTIRDNARWSDGVVLTANDFVYAWRRLVDPITASPNADLLRMVQGYEEAREDGDMEKLAVSVTEEGQLQVILAGNCPWFISDICTAAETVPVRTDIVDNQAKAALAAAEEALLLAREQGDTDAELEVLPLEWTQQAATLIANGAYIPQNWNNGYLVTEKNTRYHAKDDLGPDILTFRLELSAEDATALFENGKTDFVSCLSEEMTAQTLAALQSEDETAKAAPLGQTHCVLFNNSIGAFENGQLRQALTFAVDHAPITALCGADGVAAGGLVPYGISTNSDAEGDFRTVNGDIFNLSAEEYSKNCAAAQLALEAAGYPQGENFPALEMIYPQEDALAADMVFELCRQWKEVLGITVAAEGMSRSDYETALALGAYDLAYGFFTAEYNDPMAFLHRWTSDVRENVIYYINTAYDVLTMVIDASGDNNARTAYLCDLERLLLEDFAIIPLCFEGYLHGAREDLTGVSGRGFGVFTFHKAAFVAPEADKK